MKTFFRSLTLAAVLLTAAAPLTMATTSAASAQQLNRIPEEWSEGWSDGRYFVYATYAQYGNKTPQSQSIIQQELDWALDGQEFEDLPDGYQKGYCYALIVALR